MCTSRSQWHASDALLDRLFHVLPQPGTSDMPEDELDLDMASDKIAAIRVGALRIITAEEDLTSMDTIVGTRDAPVNAYFLNTPGGRSKTPSCYTGTYSLSGMYTYPPSY